MIGDGGLFQGAIVVSIETGLEERREIRERVELREKCKGTFFALGKSAGAEQGIEDRRIAQAQEQMQGTQYAWGAEPMC